MSLATLARKTKAKQRLRTRGKFILNMTGRGNVLGMNAKMSRGNCKGLTNCAGKRASCCAGVPNVRLPTRPTQTNTMVVGGIGGTLFGFALNTGPNIGSFTPQNINGVNIGPPGINGGEVTYNSNPAALYFAIALPTGGLLQSFFTSISFVDGCNVRTYRTSEASSFGNIGGGTRWEWNAAASGYTAAEEAAYWSGNNGKSLAVYVTDSTNNTIVPTPENLCPSQCCEFPHGGQPAPQMGYRVYLNRKSKGAYRPAGGKQCKTLAGCTSAKTVWKQGNNLDASVVTTNRRDNVLACNSDVYTAPTDCSKRCCCDCKSICGCRATDLVRYTRINKSFGCQTTKAVRMGRSASEQIARRRAAVDCIAPKHRSIYLTIDASGNISFDGCCGNQCLIQGQQYTFQIKNNDNDITFRILWCQQVPGTSIGIFNDVSIPQNTTVNASFTVPKFNNKSPCNTPDKALLGTLETNSNVLLDYCKQAYKQPQMLGSCSGR